MRIAEVARLKLGTFVRPAEETGSGLGEAGPEAEAWYRPQRVRIQDALGALGLSTGDIDIVVNCHLHFEHMGGNTSFAGPPIYRHRTELDTARTTEYTVTELVDFAGARYELLDEEAQIARGVHVIPTPGHVDGHQSTVLECEDGSAVLAGQSHDTAWQWSADALAARAGDLGHSQPRPQASPWMARLLEFDPKRVVFAHDAPIWVH